MSPNDQVFIAVTVHYKRSETPEAVLLDIVECTQSHTGTNLTSTFAKVLKDFGISDKVRSNKKDNLSILIQSQILAITCDNASSNDKMINKLAVKFVEFPGAPNCANYFAHILNLVVKSIMHQFDLAGTRSDTTQESTNELYKLAGNIKGEELETQNEQDDDPQISEEEALHIDNDEGWVNERDDMIEEELDDLEDTVKPVRFLLTKVSEWEARAV